MRLPLFLALLLAGAPLAPAFSQTRAVDTAKSSIAFVYTVEKKIPVEGRFPKFSAQVQFDEKQPEKGTVRLEIDVGAIDVGSPEGDTEARRPLWFDVAKFPKATFTSSAIKRTGEGRYEAAGELSIKGQARPVTIAVATTPAAGGSTTARGQFTVKRLLFGLGEKQWADVTQIADEVEVRFTLLLGPPK
jgi:polyisoprenoid-binding protein YceI